MVTIVMVVVLVSDAVLEIDGVAAELAAAAAAAAVGAEAVEAA